MNRLPRQIPRKVYFRLIDYHYGKMSMGLPEVAKQKNILQAILLGSTLLLPTGLAGQAIELPEVVPGQIWVHFVAGVTLHLGGGKTGFAGFDRFTAELGTVTVGKAFPSLDVLALHRNLAESTRRLRNVYRVLYDARIDSGRVAEALGQDPNVLIAEPRYVRRPLWSAPQPVPTMDTSNDPLFANLWQSYTIVAIATADTIPCRSRA